MKKIIIFEDNFFFFDLIASIYGKIPPIFTNYAKVFFCLFQLVSNTQELAGRHYTSPMWSVWHVAATLPFIWFVNFFKLIWFFFFFFDLIASIYGKIPPIFTNFYSLPLYCQCKCYCRVKKCTKHNAYSYKKCTILYIFTWNESVQCLLKKKSVQCCKYFFNLLCKILLW